MTDPLTPDEERSVALLPPAQQEWVRSLSAADRRFLWLPGQVSAVSHDGTVLDAPLAPLDRDPDNRPVEPDGWDSMPVPDPVFPDRG